MQMFYLMSKWTLHWLCSWFLVLKQETVSTRGQRNWGVTQLEVIMIRLNQTDDIVVISARHKACPGSDLCLPDVSREKSNTIPPFLCRQPSLFEPFPAVVFSHQSKGNPFEIKVWMKYLSRNIIPLCYRSTNYKCRFFCEWGPCYLILLSWWKQNSCHMRPGLQRCCSVIIMCIF